MNINIKQVCGNAVVIVSRDDGETTRAFTVGQISDWVLELMDTDNASKEFLDRVEIIGKTLQRFELDLVQPDA